MFGKLLILVGIILRDVIQRQILYQKTAERIHQNLTDA